jgi:hypothetical protein
MDLEMDCFVLRPLASPRSFPIISKYTQLATAGISQSRHQSHSLQIGSSESSGLLQPPERLLHQPSFAQADFVSGMPSSPLINRTPPIRGVLYHVRRHP